MYLTTLQQWLRQLFQTGNSGLPQFGQPRRLETQNAGTRNRGFEPRRVRFYIFFFWVVRNCLLLSFLGILNVLRLKMDAESQRPQQNKALHGFEVGNGLALGLKTRHYQCVFSFFFSSIVIFYILNCLRSYCVRIGATIRFRERGVGANEPKRCNMRRLGCKWVFFLKILLIFVYSKVSKVGYRVNERLTRLWGLRDGDIGANGPKRCNMHRLGYWWFFFFLYCIFFTY